VYHIVRPAYPDDSDAVRGLAHTPEIFDAQMRYLNEAGYHVISMRALGIHLRNGTGLPKKPIVITFDDGWRDQFEYAFPILQKYHYTATFFVFTNPIGARGFLTWEDLATLRDAGMTIGSHSLSHPLLTSITDPERLWQEIIVSKRRLEKNLHIHVTEFAYPFGYYNSEIAALVTKAGYTSARGDVPKKEQTIRDLYTLGALNAPVSLAGFMRAFPRY
jgi:peptidoglycan/xylan/chitin deacetylase (PgdA/CDA1 family)